MGKDQEREVADREIGRVIKRSKERTREPAHDAGHPLASFPVTEMAVGGVAGVVRSSSDE